MPKIREGRAAQRNDGPVGGAFLAISRILGVIACVCVFVSAAPCAIAQDADTLLKPVTPPSADHPLKELLPGYAFQSKAIRQIQDDDFKNPGMLWYRMSERLWSEVAGEAGKSCAACHNRAERAMRGVAARYPAFDPASGKVINLEQRINNCRTLNMKAPAWPWQSDALKAMSVYVRAQSRGIPVRVKVDGQAASFFEAGKAYYYRRRGQLNLSCAGCHQLNAGKKLRATTLSQGQSNGYPAYSIGLETVETLHGRFRRCNVLVRAEPEALGSDVYVNLELYLAWRGAGLPVTTPAVRN